MKRMMLRSGRSQIETRMQAVESWREPLFPPSANPLTSEQMLAMRNFTLVMPRAVVRNFTPFPDGMSLFFDDTMRPEVGVTFLADGVSVDQGDLLGDIEAALSDSPALIHQCVDFKQPKTCRACSLLWRIRRMKDCVIDVEG